LFFKKSTAKNLIFHIGLAFIIFLSGCGHIRSKQELPNELPSDSSISIVGSLEADEGSENSVEESIEEEVQINELRKEIEAPTAKVEKHLRIPVELNSHVESWIEYFTEKDHARFQRFLDRGQNYRDVIETVLEENDLPAELYYLAMIESGYQTHAQSHASAVGVWQFIAGTGKRYGLRIDQHIDERRDPIRSTEAAAKYLRDLYNVFGSWDLAMAAYNTGEIRILRAIMKARTRNFWELVQLGVLPKETASYVPKFLAVIMIGKEPEKYGFRINSSTQPYPDLEAIEIPGSIKLQTLAEKTGVSFDILKKVNPHLLSYSTPPGPTPYEVWFPAGVSSKVAHARPQLIKIATQNRRLAAISKGATSKTFHLVRRGESLSMIASKHRVSVGHLMRINNLKTTRVFVGTKLRTHAKSYSISNIVRYKVRSGDNLTIIARRFKTSPEQIKTSNKLKKNQIFIGQVLKIEDRM
jgi:membrane-bound lytic murein transglycosylase D